MSVGKVLLVSYWGNEWKDVLDYGIITDGLLNCRVIFPRVIQLPRCESLKTEAIPTRVDERTVSIEWPPTETNNKNGVDKGTLVLTWDKPANVLLTAPYSITWTPAGYDRGEDINGFTLFEYFI